MNYIEKHDYVIYKRYDGSFIEGIVSSVSISKQSAVVETLKGEEKTVPLHRVRLCNESQEEEQTSSPDELLARISSLNDIEKERLIALLEQGDIS